DSDFSIYSLLNAHAPPSFPTRRSSDLHGQAGRSADGGPGGRAAPRQGGEARVPHSGGVREDPADGARAVEVVRLARGVHRRRPRSEEHTSELQSQSNLVCRLLLEKKN